MGKKEKKKERIERWRGSNDRRLLYCIVLCICICWDYEAETERGRGGEGERVVRWEE